MLRRLNRLLVLTALFTAPAGGAARAVDLEKLVMPGPVIAGHADVEKDCARCHRAFDPAVQDELCLGCHEAIAPEIATGAGLHGRQARKGRSPSCRSCHGEHRGRDADVVGLDRETFDHGLTDFELRGAHGRAACRDCHPGARPAYRDAPHDCAGCHRDDDRHRGRLGEECGRCHAADSWAQTRYDHDETGFRLEGGHQAVACVLCHPGERYRDTPVQCAACHRLGDVHRGAFGERCEDCHGVKDWKPRERARFEHDRDTKFPLRGRHGRVSCGACHPPAQPAGRLSSRCLSCHRPDDDHGGRFGEDCERCHSEERWKQTTFDHARDARLALAGAHRDLACEACHPGTLGKEKLARDCAGCHEHDDVHRGQEGKRCDACHEQKSWRGRVAFDHDLSAFPLLGLHALAACEDCHRGGTFQDASTRCADCHRERDVHAAKLGTDCERCHDPNAWNRWRFDHGARTRFALHGAHEGLDCLACHRTAVQGPIELSGRCESCHAPDDPHRGAFGSACGTCHGDRSWQETRFGR